MTAANTLELQRKYYQSFASYQIPFQPQGEVAYPETEGLHAFYVGHHDAKGRLVRFVKLLLVREGVQDLKLSENEKPGLGIYFRVHRHPDRKATPGNRISYAATEVLTEFFEGEVGPSGGDCRLSLFRREVAFEDAYRYGPRGKLQERTLWRPDERKTVWHYDAQGHLLKEGALNGEAAEKNTPGKPAAGVDAVL